MLDMRKKNERQLLRTMIVDEVKDKHILQLLDLADERDELAEKFEILGKALGKAYRDLENKLLEQIERRMELEEECRALREQLSKESDIECARDDKNYSLGALQALREIGGGADENLISLRYEKRLEEANKIVIREINKRK